jgi:hypothetical protein
VDKRIKAIVVIGTFAASAYALYKKWPKVVAAIDTLFE